MANIATIVDWTSTRIRIWENIEELRIVSWPIKSPIMLNMPQRWYYLSQMRSDKIFLFKIFDRKPDVAQFGVHSAFINKHVLPKDVEQKNIEVRSLVFYDR